MSPPKSSCTHSVHVPFGLSPSKVDRLTFADSGRGRGREHVAGCRPVRRPPRARTEHGRVRQLVGGLVVQHEVEADGAVRSARVRHHRRVRRRRRVGEHDVHIVRIRVREAVDRHVDVGDRPRQTGDNTVRRIRAPHSRTRDRDRPTAAGWRRRRWRRWRRWRWWRWSSDRLGDRGEGVEPALTERVVVLGRPATRAGGVDRGLVEQGPRSPRCSA